jgi:protein-tyrosine-phosphatase
MAEAILRKIAGDDYITYSAGTHPRGVDPRTIEMMDEIDLDIRQQRSKDIALFVGQQFDYVITLCDRAKETCPAFPGSKGNDGLRVPSRVHRFDRLCRVGICSAAQFGDGHKTYPNPQTATALRDLFRWCLQDGQLYASEVGYVPLPASVAEKALAALNNKNSAG